MEDIVSLYSKEEFLECLKVDEAILTSWEKSGLIDTSGKYDEGKPYYNEQTLERALKIKSLMELGFDLDSIMSIKTKVGIPTGMSGKKHFTGKLITIGELAEKSGISVRTLKYWEEKELLKPDARSSGGFRLYKESSMEICFRIRDLQLFGYTLEEVKNMDLLLLPEEKLKEELGSYTNDKIINSLDNFSEQKKNLIEKIDELRKAIKRWEAITKTQEKLISHFNLKIRNENRKK